ncbi:MAG: 4'-phosphopantetheinyl transferase family protein, partial [Gemmatimonadales bacterium]
DFEVGVDIEHGHDHFDLLELAETVFSPIERNRLAQADPDKHRMLFYQHWVAKEAYIKALGGGLSIPLEAFSVSFDDAEGNGQFTIATADGTSAVRGAWVAAPEGYAAAVARAGPAWSVRIRPVGTPTTQAQP